MVSYIHDEEQSDKRQNTTLNQFELLLCWEREMKSKKYKKKIIKLLESHNFELIREKKHLVFAHKITNRKLVCPATTDCQRVFKNTLASIKLHENKYLLKRVA